MDTDCHSNDPRRDYANGSHKRDTEIGILHRSERWLGRGLSGNTHGKHTSLGRLLLESRDAFASPAGRGSANTHIRLHDIAQQWLDRGSLTRFPNAARHWQLLQRHPGFKQPLSTILRFAPFGGVFSTTLTVTSVSTISTSTAATVSTTTVTTTTSSVPPAAVTISIKVVDNQGNPVQGANVTLPSLQYKA